MNKRLYIWLLFAFSVHNAIAQDTQLSQYFSAPMYLNPAFAGANVCSRVSTNIRTQWPAIGHGYTSQILGLDHYFSDINFGGGLMFTNDAAGTGRLKTTAFSVLAAYNAQINRNLAFRVGLQGGFWQRSVNFSDLTFGDQIAKGGAASSIEIPPISITSPDFSTGILVYSKKYWGGIAIHHLNRPNESLMGNDAFRPRKFSLHGGSTFDIGKESEYDKDKQTVSVTFNYKSQLKYDQLDLGCYYSKGYLNVGLWYRGIPIFKEYAPGYPNNDAIVLILGLSKDRIRMGYSYDHTISWLRGNTSGAHEISFSYQMCKPKKKRNKTKTVVCPKF